jgi:hypothetical protein
MIDLAHLTVPAGYSLHLSVYGGRRVYPVACMLVSPDGKHAARREWTREQVRHEPIDLQAEVDAMAVEIREMANAT